MDTKKSATLESRRAGFTLVELLVVIGIIALLISMLLPALSRAKRQAVIVQCAARMQNNGIALLNYAADFKGQLPQFYMNSENPAIPDPNPPINWMWDMQVATRNALVRYGATRTSMYCPSNQAQNNNALWNFSVTAYVGGTAVPLGPNVGNLFGNDVNGNSYDGPPNMPAETGFAVLGYAWLINRLDGGFPADKYTVPLGNNNGVLNNTLIAADPIFTATTNHWCYQATTRPKNTPDSLGNIKPNVSSETEICVDATVSTSTQPYNFGDVLGGWSQPHQSSHWSGGLPIGGNILFLDGHVSWRPANTNKQPGPEVVQMKRRTMPAGGTLNFWW